MKPEFCAARTAVELQSADIEIDCASQTMPIEVRILTGKALDWEQSAWHSDSSLVRDRLIVGSTWLRVLRQGLRHVPYLLLATAGEKTVGALPLALVSSPLFGRFLVSLPYVNSAGLIAESEEAARRLIDGAIGLADDLDVRYLELRHESEVPHPKISHANKAKALMRLPLPATTDELWNGFKSKLRSQIRSGEKQDFETAWGRHDCLNEFYAVFSRNMRDLGTPVFPRRLFAAILDRFPERAEFCVLRLRSKAVAAALLIHGPTSTEVPSASSLRDFNSTNANMVMYWQLLQRAVNRGQQVFDFGRSSIDSNTYRFKKQWGAKPSLSIWQYYLRRGAISDMRPDHSKFHLAIRLWRYLPLPVANWLGPTIVRGIP